MKNLILLFVAVFCVQVIHAQIPAELSNFDFSTVEKYKELQSKTRINHNLLEIHDDFKAGLSIADKANVILDKDYIQIEAFANSPAQGAALERALVEMGLKNPIRYKHVINGMFPINDIIKTSDISSMRHITHVMPPNLNVGAVDNQADQAMLTDVIKDRFGINGTGKKIGILSDSYNTLAGEAAGIASGDLPGPGNPNGFTTPIENLSEFTGTGIDEGRAMAELVHDIAPGAELAFHSAFNGLAGFANGIVALRDAGCQIIVDDVIYFAEGMYQNGGILIEAIDEVTNEGGPDGSLYFSSAGNNLDYSYESAWTESPTPLGNGDFPYVFENGNITQSFTIPSGRNATFVLQWDEPNNLFTSNIPPYANPVESDIELLVFDATFNLIGQSVIDNVGNQIPFEAITVSNTGAAAQDYFLVITRFGPVTPTPNLIKYVVFGGSGVTFNDLPDLVDKGTCYGHANSPNAIAVGASRYDRTPAFGVSPPVLEVFSSHGGVPLLFDGIGNPYPTPLILEKPDITAPQGTNTTFFGFDYEGDGFPNFFGTSASAPHAAALGALLCSKSTKFETREDFDLQAVPRILQETAIEMEAPGFDFQSGYGLVDGEAACEKVFAEFFPIPTMGEWGLICLSILFLIFGVVTIKETKLVVEH